MSLQTTHTRALLNKLHEVQALEGKHEKYGEIFVMGMCGDPYCDCTQMDITDLRKDKAALKAELATREHIPNKQEAKAIRQQKAWAKKHR